MISEIDSRSGVRQAPQPPRLHTCKKANGGGEKIRDHHASNGCADVAVSGMEGGRSVPRFITFEHSPE
jgi:hypothetical protein